MLLAPIPHQIRVPIVEQTTTAGMTFVKDGDMGTGSI